MDRTRMRGNPDRIFISVDESTGTSTISFFPVDCGAPYQHVNDAEGKQAFADATSIVSRHPTATIHGPHFHAARPAKARVRKRG